jgi:hypothetical protein
MRYIVAFIIFFIDMDSASALREKEPDFRATRAESDLFQTRHDQGQSALPDNPAASLSDCMKRLEDHIMATGRHPLHRSLGIGTPVLGGFCEFTNPGHRRRGAQSD